MADYVSNLVKQIERKKVEIDSLESALEKERAFLMGLESALKTVSKGAVSDSGAIEKRPRNGSDIARALEAIRLHGQAMHIDSLLTALGKEQTKANRVSLSGSLAGYARSKKWFVRGATPNTFGLSGMSFPAKDQVALEEQPVM